MAFFGEKLITGNDAALETALTKLLNTPYSIKEDLSAVKNALNKKANPNALLNNKMKSPLMMAVSYGSPKLVKLLIKSGAKSNPDALSLAANLVSRAKISANEAENAIKNKRKEVREIVREIFVLMKPLDRVALLGRTLTNMWEHYATPTIARLVEMALVHTMRDTPTLLRVVNG